MWEGQAGRARAFRELAERSLPLPPSQNRGSHANGPKVALVTDGYLRGEGGADYFLTYDTANRIPSLPLLLLLFIIIIYVFAVYLCRHKVYIMLRIASHTRLENYLTLKWSRLLFFSCSKIISLSYIQNYYSKLPF